MPGSDSLGKTLMLIGVVLLIAGSLIYFGGKFLPLGRLPGDFQWERGNVSFHFPVATSILVSIVLTVLLNLLFRR